MRFVAPIELLGGIKLRRAAALAVIIVLGLACADEERPDPKARASETAASEATSTGKAIFVIEPPDSGTQSVLRQTITQELTPRLAIDPRVTRLVVSLPFDEADPSPLMASAIEVYGEAEALRTLALETEASLGTKARFHAYLVSERLPRRHEQVWPDGTPSPGVRFMALMIRNSEMSPAEFDAYWRDEHTPIALAHSVQVLNYSQNTVLERLTESSDSIDGIVVEHFASPSYSRDRILKHPIEFARGVLSGRKFIDLGRTRGALMIETVVESGTGAP